MADQSPEQTPASRPAALGGIMERNIVAVTRQRARARKQRSRSDRVADAITDFVGSMTFVYVHVAWFALWILANTGHLGVGQFDAFPYGLLTMIVSLEAIFLSTFVLIAQNRMGEESDRRADLDLQVDLLAEQEVTRVIQMLQEIHKKLGIPNDPDEDITDLETETKPEDVLEAIEHIQTRMLKK